MIRRNGDSARGGGSRIWIQLLVVLLLLGVADAAQAIDCSDLPNHTLDGDTGASAPPQIKVDTNCTIRNFPASNPLDTNFSFDQPNSNPGPWLVIFDNVVHTGEMACNSVAGHKIWFTNGSSTSIQEGCQSYLIPVEKIDKGVQGGQTTASIGVPFTYTLTMPVLFDPATGTVIDTEGSANTLHGVTLWDDLTATGVDLTYVNHAAYWAGTTTPVPHTFTNSGGLLTFDMFPIIPAGDQILIELTVVLEDTPTNAPGTVFTNIGKWDFGRLIDGVYYEPLPGEWGISPPLVIAAPDLVMTKTGPATLGLTINLGQWGVFGLDVQNTGLTDAWDVTIVDQLPDGPTGGMCNLTPEILSAQVFDSSGGPVPGKGPLIEGTDFTASYSGVPTCELTLTMLSDQSVIGPGERLIVTYRTQLDADTQDGVQLTNVAGATRWYNDESGNPNRYTFTRTLSDGTPNDPDHEDAHTVTAELYGLFFEKTAENLVTGANPAATVAPGETLRYTLRLQATDAPIDDVVIRDDLGSLNPSAMFVPDSLQVVAASLPPGAVTTNTNPTGGSHGDGYLEVGSLSVPVDSQIAIQFDVTVDPGLVDGTVITNQSELVGNNAVIADSDDPNVNGQSDPTVAGDEDPTRVTVLTTPVGPLAKAITQTTAAIGETFTYEITVPQTAYPYPIYDVVITDDLGASDADLRFVSVSKVSGGGSWVPVNTGTDTNLVIEDPTGGIDIPADGQITVAITVVLENTPTNVADLVFTNTASFLFNRADEDDDSQLPGDPGTSEPMTVVEPELTLQKDGPATMQVGTPDSFVLDVQNVGGAPAWNVTLADQLPDGPNGGMCDAAPTITNAQIFESNGSTPVSAPLVAGNDYDTLFTGSPNCLFVLTLLTAAGPIGPGERLIVTYQTQLDADTQNNVPLTNIAGATLWFSGDDSVPERRTTNRTISDGTPNDLDHEDAHTINAITNVPLLFAAKEVALYTDGGSPNLIDPGDVLIYTITVTNSGGVAATDVTLADAVPANTTYVPGSVTLNTLAVPDAAGGGSPLVAGIPISGADLTPPLPGPGEGTINPGESAVIEFRVQVDANVPGGTVIANQAFVASQELPDLPSDGDGDPNTGPEPTVVVVSDGQAVLITKQVSVLGGGAALPGSVLEYVVTVQNVSVVPALDVLITDDLDDVTPGQLAYVPATATLDGATTGIAVMGSLIVADYGGNYGELAQNQAIVLRFQATIDPGLAIGTTVTNVGVVTWGDPTETDSASVSIDVGGTPGMGALAGTVWHDANFDDVLDPGEQLLPGWNVSLYLNGALSQSTTTDASGAYAISGLAPNDASGDQYELRFTAPGAGPNTAALGRAASAFTNGIQQISDIVVASGQNLQNLDLPIDPNGVVYDSVQRLPLAGATLTLLNANGGTLVSSSCLEDPAQQGQVTLGDGFYKFDLRFGDLTCPIGGNYLIAVAPPGASYSAGISQLIPPTSGPTTLPLLVPSCPTGPYDAVSATTQYCEAQIQATAPPPSVPAGSAGTAYHLHLQFDDSQSPGSSQIFNNHIPLDPVLDGTVTITKTTSMLNVSRGQLVPYRITVSSELNLDPLDLRIVDTIPAGFHYVDGSAKVDGQRIDPDEDGRTLAFTDLPPGLTNRRTIALVLAVGAGVSEGEFVNRAQAFSDATGTAVSGVATATVRVVPDPTFSCTDVFGKVFDDRNRNGRQDPGEPGLPGVRMVTVRGLSTTTDQFGRYHITCAAVPNEARGSNVVLKLDDRTLPSGYRLSTRPVQVQRASAGKALRLNYGASIHRVISLDMADAVFEPGSTEMRLQWRPRIDRLIEELRKAPSTLRLSYLADVEAPGLVDRRLAATKRQIEDVWEAQGDYELEIESDVFWRRGAPPAAVDAEQGGAP